MLLNLVRWDRWMLLLGLTLATSPLSSFVFTPSGGLGWIVIFDLNRMPKATATTAVVGFVAFG